MLHSALERSPWVLPVFGALFGLVWGSFLNVVIHRLPIGESLVTPRSRCPSCKKPVAGYDNVPVLSYLLLGGKCRHCRTPISIRYPFVEAVVGGASVASLLRHGPSLGYVCEFAFVASMVALIFIDYDHQILPDWITLSGMLLALAVAGPRHEMTFVEALKGAALGAGSLFFVSEVYFRLKKIEGLGFGDVKMMGMVGAYLGWKGVLLTLFLGSLSGSVIGLALMARSEGGMQTKLPFGTFLGMGAIATVYMGQPVMEWYSGLF